jgi:hypothetical protein
MAVMVSTTRMRPARHRDGWASGLLFPGFMIGAAAPALLPGRVKHVAGPPTQEVAASSPSLPGHNRFSQGIGFLRAPIPFVQPLSLGSAVPFTLSLRSRLQPTTFIFPSSRKSAVRFLGPRSLFPRGLFYDHIDHRPTPRRQQVDSPSTNSDLYSSIHLPITAAQPHHHVGGSVLNAALDGSFRQRPGHQQSGQMRSKSSPALAKGRD